MRIRKENNADLPSSKIKNFIDKRKPLRLWLIGLFSVGVIAFLFFATLGYGAYLKKIGQTTYYNNVLLKISQLDFSFIKNYTKGRVSSLDEIKIDIKFKHLLRIEYLREQALKGKYIEDWIKNEEFPADLTFQGKTHRVKINLTGLTTEHLSNPDKWSFEVKVRGDDTVNGMKRFGILIPSSRGYMSDWLAFELMKDRGLIGLRADFVDVSINGKSYGVYYMEERYDKHLLENNRFRESIIFKLDGELSAYGESSLMASPDTRDQLLQLKRMWQDVMAGNMPAEKFFDQEKMASLFVITDLMNNKHPLYPGNLRFYYNPFTGLAEPIGREFGTLNKYDRNTLSLFIEKPKETDYRHHKLRADKTLQVIYDNLEFKKNYVKAAEIISKPEFLDSLFIGKREKINTLITKVYRTWPFYDIPVEKLYENQEYIRNTLFPNIDEITAYYSGKVNDTLKLHIRNQQYLPVEVSHLSWRDTMFFYPEKPIIIDSNEKIAYNVVEQYGFKIPSDAIWTDSIVPELKISYNLLGASAHKKSSTVYPWAFEDRIDHIGNSVAKTPNHQAFDFIKESTTSNTLSIPAGNWTISQDMVIPPNKRFQIEAGARIDIINSARILCYSSFHSLGEEDNHVVITSSDSTSRGIMVVGADVRSTLSYTDFSNLSNPKENGWSLPAAVTFFESPVDIEYCTFSNNQVGDDFLNIARSDFSMDNALFKNINADAFDCDFCTGSITNSAFINVGNDGVDVSGTKIKIHQITIDNAGDKGISAGEDSEMEVSLATISNSELGITAKDQSTIVMSEITLQNCRIGITLFQKKSEFGPAFVTAHEIKVEGSEIPYLIEDNCTLTLDGVVMSSNKDKVKNILYGAEYGKASK